MRPKPPKVSQLEVKDLSESKGSRSSGFTSSFATSSEDSESEKATTSIKISKKSKSTKQGTLRKTAKFGKEINEHEFTAKARLTQRFAAAIRAKLLMESGKNPSSPSPTKIQRKVGGTKRESELVNLKTRKEDML